MKKLFQYANGYLRECDWKDIGLVKLCLCAVGVMIGLGIPKKQQKPAFFAAAGVFFSTYIPLMIRFVRSVIRQKEQSLSEDYDHTCEEK